MVRRIAPTERTCRKRPGLGQRKQTLRYWRPRGSCGVTKTVRRRSLRSERRAIASKPAVDPPVAPLAGAEFRRTQQALSLEASLLQRLLFRDVLYMGAGFDPLGRRVVEEVVA